MIGWSDTSATGGCTDEPTSNAIDDLRAARYRRAGWWTDEPLLSRYKRITQGRRHGLAVVDDRQTQLTHGELLSLGADLAAQMCRAGLERGDVVVLVMPNRVDWQVLFVALLEVGTVPMTIPVTTDPETIAYLCDLVGARAIVTRSDPNGNDMLAVAGEAAMRAASRVALIGVGDVTADAELRVLSTVADKHAPKAVAGLDHLMTTSSTTGKPKAVMHTANTLAALNVTLAERLDLTMESPLFMASPLGHSVGAIHGARLSLHLGAPLVLQEKWDPDRAIALSSRHRAVFTAAATPFLKDLVDAAPPAAGVKLDTLRTFLCGGAPVPPSLLDDAAEQLPNTFVSVLWGMTEGGVTMCSPQCPPEKRRLTAGTGLPGLELQTIGADGALPADSEGELVMRGPGVFVGYHGQDDLYSASLTAEGFFRTGDLAKVTPDGYLQLTGRLKDLIIRGGVNISPVPIEDALAAYPGVRRVAVIGQPDDRLGERICAVVVPSDAGDVRFEDVIEWVSTTGLPRRMWPERVEVVTDMPQTPAGKIRKNELRRQLFGTAT